MSQEIRPQIYPIDKITQNDDWVIGIPIVDDVGDNFVFTSWQAHPKVDNLGSVVAEF